jgi:hypothetical protein
MEPLRLTLELWSLTLEEPWLTLGLWRIWELCFYEAPDLDPHQSFAGFWYPAKKSCISLVLVTFKTLLPPPPIRVWFDLLIG